MRKRFRRRYREIDRERFRLGRHDAPPGGDDSRELASIVPAILRDAGLHEELWERRLLDEWTVLVGPQVARHARPGKIERGTLHVFVSHSGWLNELSRYGKKQILESVQKRFGAACVRDIRLQLDPDLNPVRSGVSVQGRARA